MGGGRAWLDERCVEHAEGAKYEDGDEPCARAIASEALILPKRATEACLAAAGHTSHGFGCRLASYGALTALGECIEHYDGRVSGGLTCVNGTSCLH